jgi:hypothetical protein
LAGRWYTWFVRQHEEDPGKPKYWRKLVETLLWDVLRPEAPEEYDSDPKSDPHWEWAKEPEVRAAVRPRIAEQARVASFLANDVARIVIQQIVRWADHSKRSRFSEKPDVDCDRLV